MADVIPFPPGISKDSIIGWGLVGIVARSVALNNGLWGAGPDEAEFCARPVALQSR
jgi:hypothetical protein